MQKDNFNTIIIGAGPAGLSLSYFLQKRRLSHLILEKARPCSQWYDRFDNFRMNTANWMNILPGAAEMPEDKNHLQQAPDQLATGAQILDYLKLYARFIDPPIQASCEVTGLNVLKNNHWQLHTSSGQFHCRHVVLCTGSAARQKWPELASNIPEDIPSIYANTYRNPQQVLTSRVLVVGSGSSGIQICEDLARSSGFDEIILSVSGNRRFPWKILGIPIHTLIRYSGLFDLASDNRLARWIIKMNSNQGDPATPPSPESLARVYGVKCVPKLQAWVDDHFVTVNKQRINTEDLTIIWCTGYAPDYSILPNAVQDTISSLPGWPTASHGEVPGFPGLHFLGMRYQSTLSSHILYGIGRDAARMADTIQSEMA